MSLRNKIKTTEKFPDKRAREEFLSLPRAEFLLDATTKKSAGEIGKMIVNTSLEIADRFSMAVPDDLMAGAGIREGDHAVIQKMSCYYDGDIIAAKIGERLLIRRYFQSSHRIRLECATTDRRPVILDTSTPGFSILGCVVQVIREIR